MTEAKRILLLDRSGEPNPDLLILLKLAGYQVNCFEDDLLAANSYHLMRETDQAFDLVIAVDGGRKAELDRQQLIKNFDRLALLTGKKSELSLFYGSEERLLHCHSGELLDIIAAELERGDGRCH